MIVFTPNCSMFFFVAFKFLLMSSGSYKLSHSLHKAYFADNLSLGLLLSIFDRRFLPHTGKSLQLRPESQERYLDRIFNRWECFEWSPVSWHLWREVDWKSSWTSQPQLPIHRIFHCMICTALKELCSRLYLFWPVKSHFHSFSDEQCRSRWFWSRLFACWSEYFKVWYLGELFLWNEYRSKLPAIASWSSAQC